MCRFLGVVSRQPQTIAEGVGPAMSSFVELSRGIHTDGWGVAWAERDEFRSMGSTSPAHSDGSFYEAIANTKSTAALAHLRKATLGLPVSLENTHPFLADPLAFCHNGSIREMTALASLLLPDSLNQVQGTTDSELYFRAIVEQFDDSSILDAVTSTVRTIQSRVPYTGLNSLVMHPDTVVAVSSYDLHAREGHPDDYYHLFYRESADNIVVASSGWLNEEWTRLPNNSVLTIDRASLDFSITDIATGRELSAAPDDRTG